MFSNINFSGQNLDWFYEYSWVLTLNIDFKAKDLDAQSPVIWTWNATNSNFTKLCYQSPAISIFLKCNKF